MKINFNINLIFGNIKYLKRNLRKFSNQSMTKSQKIPCCDLFTAN